MVTHLCNCDFHKSKFIKARLEQSSRILNRNLGILLFEIRELSISIVYKNILLDSNVRHTLKWTRLLMRVMFFSGLCTRIFGIQVLGARMYDGRKCKGFFSP